MTHSEARKGKLESFPDGQAGFYQALGDFLKKMLTNTKFATRVWLKKKALPMK